MYFYIYLNLDSVTVKKETMAFNDIISVTLKVNYATTGDVEIRL